jgi:histone deacetylase 1/2
MTQITLNFSRGSQILATNARINVTNQNYFQNFGRRYNVGMDADGAIDCPVFDGIYDFSALSSGCSIEAAKRINVGDADIAINWSGGKFSLF